MVPDPSVPSDPLEVLRLADLPGVERLGAGKVRERYAIGTERILLVATDRISAFDVILPTPVPDKGAVLTGLTEHWLRSLADLVPNHLVTCDVRAMPAGLDRFASDLQGRAMLCRRAEPLPVECVARGYLAGSAWSEYQADGTVAGVTLPAGLEECARLPEPIFTPATKATGHGEHDENITFAAMADLLGDHLGGADLLGADLAERLRALTLAVYERLAGSARAAGLLLADTKLEFGLVEGQLVLIDEVGTPDSSRYWPADAYEPGRPQPSFDKQYVRDWLLASGWDRTPPAPPLPEEVVAATRERYVAAYERLTDAPFALWAGTASAGPGSPAAPTT